MARMTSGNRGGGASLTASRRSFLAQTNAGALIANLSQPFGAGTSYAVVGAIPPQIGLTGATVIAGATAAVADATYTVKIRASSADGLREVAETLSFAAVVADGAPPSPPPAVASITNPHVLVVGGQSQGMTPNANTANRPANIQSLPGAYIYQPSTGTIEPYVAGSNSCPYSFAPGVDQPWGPEAEAARQFLASNPGKQIVIVKLSIGTTPLQKGATFQNGTGGAQNANIIECWDATLANSAAGAAQADRNINAALLLKSYVAATAAALAGKTIVRLGMFWLQGQNDAYFSATANTYGAALASFSTWARANLLAGGSSAFVMSLVEDHVSAWPYQAPVRAAQQSQAANVLTDFLANTDDVGIGADGFHYAPAGTITLGGRMFALLSATHAAAPASTPSDPANLSMTNPGYAAGRFGQGLTAGYGIGAPLGNISAVTTEGWYNGAAPPGVKVLWGQVNSIFVGLNTNGTVFAAVGGSNQVTITSPASICDGAWHHLEAACGPGGAYLFVDGILVANSSTPWGNTGRSEQTTSTFNVRQFAVGNGLYSEWGAIDQVAVWTSVRHTAAFAPPGAYVGSEGMARLYLFDGNGND